MSNRICHQLRSEIPPITRTTGKGDGRAPVRSPPRRECNLAFFERIHVCEVENVDRVEAEPGDPFDALLDPNLHAAALAYEARMRAREDVKAADVASLNIDYWVGDTRLELMTSSV